MDLYNLPAYRARPPLHVRQTASPITSTPSISVEVSVPPPSSTTSSPPSSSSSSAPLSSQSSSSSSNPSSSSSPTSTSSSTSTESSSSSTSADRSSSLSVASSSSASSTTSAPASTTSTPPSSPAFNATSAPLSSSGFIFTTFTSSIVTEINGTPTTLVTPIVTALRSPTPSRSTSSRTAVITGSAIGGLALLILSLATLFFFRRRADKRRYSFLARKIPPSRSAFLAGEGLDEHAAPRPRSYADEAPHAYELPPRLFRARGSESGSIFQEAVWPPPREGSRLTDPLARVGGTADLSRIVDDVMGPSGDTPPRLRGGSWDTDADSVALLDHSRDMSMNSRSSLLLDPDAGRNPLTLTLTNPDEDSPLSPAPPHSPRPMHSPKTWLERSPKRTSQLPSAGEPSERRGM
ncbi:hypothetical protein BV25DRAFT_769328 [Artomyces pyxidatus]|uniref:Uncharacterized protein n=1 Tax=Artomyces pyxidatus TaxID=48021 RepID=A0ACB8T0C2_9AGAM|nr:hypothetical protein BV25DRAFT_769328 [Artomyces pyxidatus]